MPSAETSHFSARSGDDRAQAVAEVPLHQVAVQVEEHVGGGALVDVEVRCGAAGGHPEGAAALRVRLRRALRLRGRSGLAAPIGTTVGASVGWTAAAGFATSVGLAAAAGAAGAVVAAGAAGFAASAGLLSAVGLVAGTPGVHASSSGIVASTPSDSSTVRRVILRLVILDVISIASSRCPGSPMWW